MVRVAGRVTPAQILFVVFVAVSWSQVSFFVRGSVFVGRDWVGLLPHG